MLNTGDPKELEGAGFHLRSDLHLLRKVWHMGTGIAGLTFYYQSGISALNMAIILVSLSLASIILEVSRLNIAGLNTLVVKFMGPFMRESELKSFSGFPFYALGSGLALFLFPEKLAVLAIIFLVFGDPISATFGVLYGRDKILPNKSLQGTAAGFISCYLATLFYGLSFGAGGIALLFFAVLAGLLGAFSELISGKIDDNLTIPLISGAGLILLNLLIPIF
ncbi:MAG: hypothetical protein HN509_01550 [Halobacteriovoraceae bacterium]|nr:hypothetical protein [Halobacteriovoraceae bacterium]MBT5095741.1 hypothetical protein [Halobacteriovoraceae bacterium]